MTKALYTIGQTNACTESSLDSTFILISLSFLSFFCHLFSCFLVLFVFLVCFSRLFFSRFFFLLFTFFSFPIVSLLRIHSPKIRALREVRRKTSDPWLEGTAPPWTNALAMSRNSTRLSKLSFGCRHLDGAFEGGIPVQGITEVGATTVFEHPCLPSYPLSPSPLIMRILVEIRAPVGYSSFPFVSFSKAESFGLHEKWFRLQEVTLPFHGLARLC